MATGSLARVAGLAKDDSILNFAPARISNIEPEGNDPPIGTARRRVYAHTGRLDESEKYCPWVGAEARWLFK